MLSIAFFTAALAVMTLGTKSAPAQELTGDELYCQLNSALAIGKFIRSKAQCIENCQKQAFVNQVTANCGPPYSGSLQGCINSTEGHTQGDIHSSCNQDCPDCYASTDCDSSGNTRVADAEAHVEALSADVFCDDSASVDGLTLSEFKCQRTVRKFVTAFAAAKLKCYAKCRKSEIGGKAAPGSCGPPATDPKTMACIDKIELKAASSIDTKCESSITPSADKPECGFYPTRNGAAWVAAEEAEMDTRATAIFCNETTTTTTTMP
jgi:hypothetical protein